MCALPVQRREILACAPTGSGKTAAFLLPLLQALAGDVKREPEATESRPVRALVLAPTLELAKQVIELEIPLILF